MPKTINYELAKKLHDAGVIIMSEKSYTTLPKYAMKKLVKEAQETRKFPAPNCEEVIEFLESIQIDEFHLSIEFYSGLTIVNYRSSGSILFPCIEKPTLIEALEATLEYYI